MLNSITESLYLIDLEQDLAGFRRFIGSWLYRGESTTFLVDPGPSHSIDRLLSVLAEIPVQSIDYILLTHIHIDHAGGTGKLLEAFPDAHVICHPKGISHMVDPAKLWEGSLKVLGDIARAYGEIASVPAEKISFQEQIDTADGPIKVIETPGHAVHHQCFQFGEWLFAGEVAGVRHKTDSLVYARPATPPVFKLEVSLGSLDKVISLNPANLCLGHFGFVESPQAFLLAARKQLLQWVETVKQQLDAGSADPVADSIAALKSSDPLISRFESLEADIRQREEYFIGNSIKGILQSLRD